MDIYKHRALDILKFAINHNKRFVNEIEAGDYYICNELGGIKKYGDDDYYGLVIFVDENIEDSEIKELVDYLPAFKKAF